MRSSDVKCVSYKNSSTYFVKKVVPTIGRIFTLEITDSQ